MAFSFEPFLAISAGHFMAVSAGPEQESRRKSSSYYYFKAEMNRSFPWINCKAKMVPKMFVKKNSFGTIFVFNSKAGTRAPSKHNSPKMIRFFVDAAS